MQEKKNWEEELFSDWDKRNPMNDACICFTLFAALIVGYYAVTGRSPDIDGDMVVFCLFAVYGVIRGIVALFFYLFKTWKVWAAIAVFACAFFLGVIRPQQQERAALEKCVGEVAAEYKLEVTKIEYGKSSHEELTMCWIDVYTTSFPNATPNRLALAQKMEKALSDRTFKQGIKSSGFTYYFVRHFWCGEDCYTIDTPTENVKSWWIKKNGETVAEYIYTETEPPITTKPKEQPTFRTGKKEVYNEGLDSSKYSHVDDFYDAYYDDFYDLEEAEDYFD